MNERCISSPPTSNLASSEIGCAAKKNKKAFGWRMRKKELVRHFSRFGVASPPPPTSSLARARLDVLSEKGNTISPRK